MIIEIILLDKQAKKFEQEIIKKARRLANLLHQKGKVEVYLIGGQRMRSLNRRFRGKNKSTNVLSFVSPEGFPGAGLGEVYLDPVYIKKCKEDPALMLAHGVLHILGYDHEKKNDKIKMENKERQLMRQFYG